jgi:sigma-E factor negative regulatory protein RseB
MRCLALFCLLVAPLMQASGQDVQSWLDKMSRAIDTLNYEGTFVFVHGGKIETMRIVHGTGEDGMRERLMSLNGEPREVIRDQDVLTCIWPASRFVVVGTSRTRHGVPAAIPADTQRLEQYYDMAPGKLDRVAGRDCRTLHFEPKDSYRYGYRMCIDGQTGLPLKSEILDERDQPIEQVMFTSLKVLDQIPDRRFQASMDAKGFTWYRADDDQDTSGTQPDAGWQVDALPPGFDVAANLKHPMAVSEQPVQHIVLSDGLASVSVFIAKPGEHKELFEGESQNGSMHAYARTFAGHQITVVGEVPRRTVEMIGTSVHYRPGRP